MLYSMTGFGKAEKMLSNDKTLFVELKTLNGKNFDLNHYRFPVAFRALEMNIRSLVQTELVRGTVDISLLIKQHGSEQQVSINHELAKYYLQEIKTLSEELSLQTSQEGLLTLLMKMPEVVSSEAEEPDESEWDAIEACIKDALRAVIDFRKTEGAALSKDLMMRVRNIQQYLEQVIPLEEARIVNLRSRIQNNLDELNLPDIDKNRFEQEIIYYLEKLDISEEKQRLAAHCNYFLKMVEEGDEQGIGKKLGFILQEIGREINTMGSKANDAEMQKIVVGMKDELEKAKEQVLNVL